VRDIIQELHNRVKDDLTELDVNSMYDEMLDECYDMSEVGGPFSHMLASKILSECDPIAYRCGFTDWLDGEGFYEVDGEYYHGPDLERVKDKLIDGLEDEISNLEEQVEDMPQSDIDAGVDLVCRDLIDIVNDDIAKLRKYSF
jgi:hypothetical protein